MLAGYKFVVVYKELFIGLGLWSLLLFKREQRILYLVVLYIYMYPVFKSGHVVQNWEEIEQEKEGDRYM